VGLAEIHEILFFIAGVALILVEVFVTPGFGLPGILGVLLADFERSYHVFLTHYLEARKLA